MNDECNCDECRAVKTPVAEEIDTFRDVMQRRRELKAVEKVAVGVGPPIYRRGETLFADAAKAINGDRQTAYGDPEDSFENISIRWSQYLCGKKYIAGRVRLTAADVAFMMADFKMARECGQGKRDNLVDAAGYLGILDDFKGV